MEMLNLTNINEAEMRNRSYSYTFFDEANLMFTRRRVFNKFFEMTACLSLVLWYTLSKIRKVPLRFLEFMISLRITIRFVICSFSVCIFVLIYLVAKNIELIRNALKMCLVSFAQYDNSNNIYPVDILKCKLYSMAYGLIVNSVNYSAAHSRIEMNTMSTDYCILRLADIINNFYEMLLLSADENRKDNTTLLDMESDVFSNDSYLIQSKHAIYNMMPYIPGICSRLCTSTRSEESYPFIRLFITCAMKVILYIVLFSLTSFMVYISIIYTKRRRLSLRNDVASEETDYEEATVVRRNKANNFRADKWTQKSKCISIYDNDNSLMFSYYSIMLNNTGGIETEFYYYNVLNRLKSIDARKSECSYEAERNLLSSFRFSNKACLCSAEESTFQMFIEKEVRNKIQNMIDTMKFALSTAGIQKKERLIFEELKFDHTDMQIIDVVRGYKSFTLVLFIDVRSLYFKLMTVNRAVALTAPRLKASIHWNFVRKEEAIIVSLSVKDILEMNLDVIASEDNDDSNGNPDLVEVVKDCMKTATIQFFMNDYKQKRLTYFK